MVNSTNKVRLQKLVREQNEAQVVKVEDTVIYCKGETAINLIKTWLAKQKLWNQAS